MSLGEEIIGTFNVNGDSHISEIKLKAIELIDLIERYAKNERRLSLSVSGIEQATMMGIKSTFKEVK